METQSAKELVIRAGKELTKEGLIVRTCGNISCRTDGNASFAITPSGRPYDTLTPEQIVLCKTADASYEGDIKPSSERGIHALVYRMHPDANFVIHTHQLLASVIGAAGISSMPVPEGSGPFGSAVPVAAYGLPGTKKLREGVGEAMRGSSSCAVIMAHHGALCYGRSYEEAFSAAKELERACERFLARKYVEKSGRDDFSEENLYTCFYSAAAPGRTMPGEPLPLYSSKRLPDGFRIEERGETYRFDSENMPDYAKIHSAVYLARKDINFIEQETKFGLLALSAAGEALQPLLDDFAQIVGRSAHRAERAQPKEIVHALRGRLGVLVPGAGALCCAATASDANAVRLVMGKNALTRIGTSLFGGGRNLSFLDCGLMHFVYTMSYSKQAKKN